MAQRKSAGPYDGVAQTVGELRVIGGPNTTAVNMDNKRKRRAKLSDADYMKEAMADTNKILRDKATPDPMAGIWDGKKYTEPFSKSLPRKFTSNLSDMNSKLMKPVKKKK